MLTDLTDEQLLAQALAGDEDAFTALYRRRQGPIFRFALHMSGSSLIAEEVTQDVFMFLIQRGRDFDPSRAALGAYLFGVARNYVRRAMERNYTETALSSPVDDEAQSLMVNSDPGDGIARQQASTAVWKAVLSLPEHYREVVVLCDLQELTLCGRGGSAWLCAGYYPFAAAPGARHAQPEAATFGGRCARDIERYGEVRIMTCREFEHRATSLTLRELSQAQDQQILDHAGECQKCASWLQQQRTLAAAMQTLQARDVCLRGWPRCGTGAAPGIPASAVPGYAAGDGERFHSHRHSPQPVLRSWGLCSRGGSHRWLDCSWECSFWRSVP